MSQATIHIAPTPKCAPNHWTQILDEIQPELSARAFETWFEPTEFDRLENGVLYVRTPSSFHRSRLSSQYRELIVHAARQLNLPIIKIVFEERRSA